jgi:hypothetical protein
MKRRLPLLVLCAACVEATYDVTVRLHRPALHPLPRLRVNNLLGCDAQPDAALPPPAL